MDSAAMSVMIHAADGGTDDGSIVGSMSCAMGYYPTACRPFQVF